MGAQTVYARMKGIFVHPVVLILLFGLVVRMVLSATLTYCYDVSYWGYVIENMESGNGLYGLPGFYYTPVWGYIVATLGVAANFLLGAGVLGISDPNLIFSLDAGWDFYTDLVMTPAMVMVFKVFFTLVDIAVSWMLYTMVMERTGDERKATAAFGMWFLCPIVVYTSCVQAMFDPVMVLLMMVSVFLATRREYFLAGMAIAMAILCKFFAGYLIFILLAYVFLAEHKDRGMFLRSSGHAILGALVMSFIIFLPNLLNGTMEEAFAFILNRVEVVGSADGSASLWDNIASVGYTLVMALQVVIIGLEVYLAYRFSKSPDDPGMQDRFFLYALLSATVVFLWTPTPTYLLIIIPFLIYHVVVSDRRFALPYVMLALAPMLYSLVMNGAGILFQASTFYGIVSPETIAGLIDWLDATTFGISHQDILNITMGAAETVAIYSVLAVHLLNRRADRARECAV